MFDHLLESSHRDDSNTWSIIGFSAEITQVESFEVHFMYIIWSSVHLDLIVKINLNKMHTICIAISPLPCKNLCEIGKHCHLDLRKAIYKSTLDLNAGMIPSMKLVKTIPIVSLF